MKLIWTDICMIWLILHIMSYHKTSLIWNISHTPGSWYDIVISRDLEIFLEKYHYISLHIMHISLSYHMTYHSSHDTTWYDMIRNRPTTWYATVLQLWYADVIYVWYSLIWAWYAPYRHKCWYVHDIALICAWYTVPHWQSLICDWYALICPDTPHWSDMFWYAPPKIDRYMHDMRVWYMRVI